MKYHPNLATVEQTQQRVECYENAGLVEKIGLLITRQAAKRDDHELLRREALGQIGRISEDVNAIAYSSEDIHGLLLDRENLEELSYPEYREMQRAIMGGDTSNKGSMYFSVKHEDELSLSIVSSIAESMSKSKPENEINAYRYASLSNSTPFIVGLHRDEIGNVSTQAVIPVNLLPYEVDLGNVDEMALPLLEAVVAHDLTVTHRAINELRGGSV